MSDITEFTDLNPEEFHLVGKGATGFPVLLAKSIDESLGAEQLLEMAKSTDVTDDEWATKANCQDEWAVKFVSAADRRKMAAAGSAMPDGSFPIDDEGHLRSAVGRLGNYKGDKSAAKRHIIKRARALGLTHMLPEDWNVSKDDASKDTYSADASLGQTHSENMGGDGGCSPEAEDGGEPRHVAAEGESVDLSDGTGDTAPDKDLQEGAAESQTNADKADVDMTGSKAPNGAQDAATTSEAASQTRADAEKAEGGANAGSSKDGASNTQPSPTTSKEIDMDRDELTKLLDERDARRDADRKARKAAKKARKAAEAAAAGSPAEGADASKAEGAGESAEELRKELADITARLEKVEGEPAASPVLNGLGVVAAVRDPKAAPSVFKELEEAVEKAETPEEAQAARARLTTAKMIAANNAAEADPKTIARIATGQGIPLLTNKRELGEDRDLRYA